MRTRRLSAILALVSMTANLLVSQEASERVNRLLSTMTLEEKVGQMTQPDFSVLTGRTDDVTTYAFGSVLWGGDTEIPDITAKGWSAVANELQTLAGRTRLKIPLILGVDAVHGHNNVNGAVLFPHNIGLGATRDAKLVERVARVTSEEMTATGVQWDFAPCVAVARNERWGRTYESFGEDPELVRALGAAYVRGMQGARLMDESSSLACVKHYVGDGGTTNGKDQGNTEIDEATLRAIHLPGYIDAIAAGARSIMASFNSWNGAKLHGHKYLMTDVLKGELKFGGFIVSDWAGIDQLPGSYKDQIAHSVNAGMDMMMIPNGPGADKNYVQFITLLVELVREGTVPQARVDDAVRRILVVKEAMGLFDRKARGAEALSKVGSQEHRAVAREAVRRSLVLLKNGGEILPLSKNSKRIHVAGRGADNIAMQCGGWTIDWQGKQAGQVSGGTTIRQAVQAAVSGVTKVTYSPDGDGAKGADVAIVVVGEEPYAEMFGDRDDLRLSAQDREVIDRVKASGVPMVVVLLSGRPMLIGDVLPTSDAFVAAWLPGTEGAGVTDVLFGDAPPTGKLPHSWPRSMDQIPVNVGDATYDPLFPYGFGLSFTQSSRLNK